MKKHFTWLFIMGIMLFTYNTAYSCDNCDCGCKNSKECTCIKDEKGNILRPEVIGINNVGQKSEKCEKKCKRHFGHACCKSTGDEQVCSKSECEKKVKSDCTCTENCTEDCKCSCHKQSCDKHFKNIANSEEKCTKSCEKNACSIEKLSKSEKKAKRKFRLLFWKNKTQE